MTDIANKSMADPKKLSALIKNSFPKLSDEEIGFQASNPAKFYDAVKTKQGIAKDEAEKTVKKLDAECAASCAADKAKAAAPISKAS